MQYGTNNGYGFAVRIPGSGESPNDTLLRFLAANSELHIEQNPDGSLYIMPPVHSDGAERNAEVTRQLGNWFKRSAVGKVYDSSAGFRLPDGAMRSPDAAWVCHRRIAAVQESACGDFLKACPNFVVELKSGSDSLALLQEKMGMWLANGAELGWLIDPRTETVYVHRPGRPVQEVQGFGQSLSAHPEVPGFALDLRELLL